MKSLIVAILILTSSIYAKNIWSENPNFKGINKNGVVRFNDFSKLAKILSPTVANLQVEVEVKRISSSTYEILDGLQANDEVINNALFLLDSDAVTNALYEEDDNDW